MTAIKAYLLRLILCGLFVSLSGALLRGKRAGRVLTLCGGCLLILTALRPLLRVDLGQLPDLVSGLTRSQRVVEARETNDAILRGLVEEQTAAWVEERAGALGLTVRAEVTARAAEAGTFVPDSIRLSGPATEDQRQALLVILARELELPAEKLRWSGG